MRTSKGTSMPILKIRAVWLFAGLSLLVSPGCPAQRPVEGPGGNLPASIAFRFDILDMVTNHQFAGQKNSFHVEYQYGGMLKGGEFDPAGHAASAKTFPYFQSVRNAILAYVARYPDKDDFFEVFGVNICRHVLREFPQIQKITLRIDIPAYGGVDLDRGETITVERNPTKKRRR